MTPQERDLLTNLVSRLRQSPPQQTDPEAEGMINDLVTDNWPPGFLKRVAKVVMRLGEIGADRQCFAVTIH